MYNQLKVVRHMLTWAPTVELADAYERMLLNGILGVQQLNEIGSLSYMTPLGTAVQRTRYDWWGFGTGNNSFWCCYGTSIESFGKLSDSVFFESTALGAAEASRTRTLYVMQPLISAVASWNKYVVSVDAVEMYGDSDTISDCGNCVKSNIEIMPQSPGTAVSGVVLLIVRVPGWAIKPTINGIAVKAGEFTAINVNITATDTAAAPMKINCVFGMEARVVPILDKRPEYAKVGAFAFGPHVLAAITGNSTAGLGPLGYTFPADASTASKWVTVSKSSSNGLRFSAKASSGRTLELMRLSEVQHETYSVYFNVTTAK